ncbi:MAG: acyl carrier protein [Candidatus Krumholzibacteriia bacterium]
MQLREQIRGFIIENFLFGDAEPLGDDAVSLLDNGIVDSVGVMEMVAWLEQNHGVKVEDQELVPENFDSVERLVRFVERKRGSH